jgi:ParB family transcriptional regulator, chromosome partitioning protein
MKRELVLVTLASCIFANIRTDFGSEAELRALGESLKKRQHIPLLLRPNFLVIDGERRVRGALLVGLTQLWAVVTDEELTPEQIRAIQFESAFHRADLTVWEKTTFLLGLAGDHPDWTNRQIAERLSIGESMVGRILSIRDCIPAVKEAVKAGLIGVKSYHQISLATEEEQPALLAKAINGSAEDVARQRRQRPTATAPAARTSKIKCPLPSGHVITVAGHEMSLDEAVESLQQAIKAIKKAIDTGLDASTAQRVWADMAKAGA